MRAGPMVPPCCIVMQLLLLLAVEKCKERLDALQTRSSPSRIVGARQSGVQVLIDASQLRERGDARVGGRSGRASACGRGAAQARVGRTRWRGFDGLVSCASRSFAMVCSIVVHNEATTSGASCKTERVVWSRAVSPFTLGTSTDHVYTWLHTSRYLAGSVRRKFLCCTVIPGSRPSPRPVHLVLPAAASLRLDTFSKRGSLRCLARCMSFQDATFADDLIGVSLRLPERIVGFVSFVRVNVAQPRRPTSDVISATDLK